MLEQVRESGAAGALVLRADVVPDVHRHDGRLMILVHQQREAVLQHEALVRDDDRRRRGDAGGARGAGRTRRALGRPRAGTGDGAGRLLSRSGTGQTGDEPERERNKRDAGHGDLLFMKG